MVVSIMSFHPLLRFRDIGMRNEEHYWVQLLYSPVMYRAEVICFCKIERIRSEVEISPLSSAVAARQS